MKALFLVHLRWILRQKTLYLAIGVGMVGHFIVLSAFLGGIAGYPLPSQFWNFLEMIASSIANAGGGQGAVVLPWDVMVPVFSLPFAVYIGVNGIVLFQRARTRLPYFKRRFGYSRNGYLLTSLVAMTTVFSVYVLFAVSLSFSCMVAAEMIPSAAILGSCLRMWAGGMAGLGLLFIVGVSLLEKPLRIAGIAILSGAAVALIVYAFLGDSTAPILAAGRAFRIVAIRLFPFAFPWTGSFFASGLGAWKHFGLILLCEVGLLSLLFIVAGKRSK